MISRKTLYFVLSSAFASCLAFLLAPVVLIAARLPWAEAFPAAYSERPLRDFASVAVDGLRARASAFVAFVKRALTHDAYRAGHFDPGRMAA